MTSTSVRGRGQQGFGGAHQPSTHYFNMAENEAYDDDSWSSWWMMPVHGEEENMEDYGSAPPAAAEQPAEEGGAMMADDWCFKTLMVSGPTSHSAHEEG